MASTRCGVVTFVCGLVLLSIGIVTFFTGLGLLIIPLAGAGGVTLLIGSALTLSGCLTVRRKRRDAEIRARSTLHPGRRPPAGRPPPAASTAVRNSSTPVPGSTVLSIQRPSSQRSSARPPTVAHGTLSSGANPNTAMSLPRVEDEITPPGADVDTVTASHDVSGSIGEADNSTSPPGYSVPAENNLNDAVSELRHVPSDYPPQDELPSYDEVVLESLYEIVNRL